jgi:hypothetical protein
MFYEYMLYDNTNKWDINAFATDCCYARYANDAQLLGRPCNSAFADFRYSKNSQQHKHLPLELRKATMCIEAVCDIRKGDEIYVPYGSRYWSSPEGRILRDQLLPQKRKLQRVIRIIKRKLENKAKYVLQGRKRKLERAQGQEQVQVRVPVWPVDAESSKFAMAEWADSTQDAAEILSYDMDQQKWLILNKTPESLPPRTRYVFHRCELPPL